MKRKRRTKQVEMRKQWHLIGDINLENIFRRKLREIKENESVDILLCVITKSSTPFSTSTKETFLIYYLRTGACSSRTEKRRHVKSHYPSTFQRVNSVIIYRRAATKATRAPSPPRAIAFRLAAESSVPVGTGGVVVVPLVGIGAMVVVVLTATEVTKEVVVAMTEVSVAVVGTTEREVEVLTAVVEEAPADGMTRETPASAQRPPAALTVASKSAAEQAAWTHGVRAVMKPVALQIHGISVVWQPVLPKEVRAQERAQGGIWSSWAETVAAAAAATMMVENFILNVIVGLLKVINLGV
jgi:hypothetical protein